MTYDEWLFEHFGGAGLPTTGADILARNAWEAATKSEREACAKTCEALWDEEAKAAANGTQEPKYHDCIECAYAIRERSNADVTGLAPGKEDK